MTWDQINDVAAQAAGISRKRRQGVAIVTPERYTTADAELLVDGIVYADDEVLLTTARCAHCGTHVELTHDERTRAKVALVEVANEVRS